MLMAPTITAGSAVAFASTRVCILSVGRDASVNVSRYEIEGGSTRWDRPFRVSPPDSARPGSSPVAVLRSGRALQAFWPCTDGSIGSVWGDGARRAWEKPARIAPASSARGDSPVTAVSRSGGWVDVFWISPDGDIVNVRSEPNAPSAWSPAIKIAGAGAAGVGSGLFVVARLPQHVDVFWTGPDGRVAGNWWDNSVNNARWNQPFVTAPAGGSGSRRCLAVVARIPGHVDVFWVNLARAVNCAWWDASTGRSDWSAASNVTPPGIVAADSGLAAVARSPQRVDVFWTGNEGAVMSSCQDVATQSSDWSTPVKITRDQAVARGSSLSSVSCSPEHMDLFWTAPDGSMVCSGWDARAGNGDWAPPTRIGVAQAP
jgi:hypothetical protein